VRLFVTSEASSIAMYEVQRLLYR